MARFVVLVIDSFGVGAMKDVTLVRPQDAGANTCGHILSQLPHLQLPALEKLGANQRIGVMRLAICSRQTPQPGVWQSCNMKVAIPLWGIRRF